MKWTVNGQTPFRASYNGILLSTNLDECHLHYAQ